MPTDSFFDAVLAQLRACKHHELHAIAALSGVPEGTIRKIKYGEVRDPRVQTVQALHDYFVQKGDLQPPANAADSRARPGAARERA